MFRLLATSAVALVTGAAPLFAEVTPAQVWDNLRDYYTDMGYQVTTGSSETSNNTLTLGDIAITSDAEGSEVDIVIPKMMLQQTGDNRVRTVIEGDMTASLAATDATLTATGATGQKVVVEAIVALPGNEMLSSGSTADMLHEIVYPTVTVTARLAAADEAPTAAEMPFSMTLHDVKGDYRSVTGEGSVSSYDMTASAMDLLLTLREEGTAADPATGEDAGEGEGAVDGATAGDATGGDMADGGETAADTGTGQGSLTLQSRIDGLTITGSMTAPTGQMNMAEKPHEALAAGLVIEGKLAMGKLSGTAEFTGTDPEGATSSGNASFASDSSELTVGMSKAGLTYDASAKGSKAQLTTSDLPFPISYAVETVSGTLAFPVAKSDQPQPYRLGYHLAGLTLADSVWDLFDPQKSLPRDPADIAIDLEGEAMVTEDLLDPAFSEKMAQAAGEQAAGEQAADGAPAEDGATGEDGATDEDATGESATADGMTPPAAIPVPFRPETVRITRFALDALGAQAEVTGDLRLPEGAPQPVGTIKGEFTGVNALLDKLVSAGLVPQEQMMAARMMVAMFARPVADNPDQLQTEVEFREDGAILANGQQVK